MTNRTEVNNGGSIGTALNDQQVLLAETNDMTVSVSDGASPYIFFDNAPSWVQGTDVDGTSGMELFLHILLLIYLNHHLFLKMNIYVFLFFYYIFLKPHLFLLFFLP